MDISSISTMLTSVKTAVEIAKLLKDSGLTLEKAEAKLKLAELIDALAEIKMQLADVRVLLLEKDEEISQLQEEMKIKGNMVFERPYYWLKTEKGKDGPFCQVCFEKDNRPIRLQNKGVGFWICEVCETTYVDSNYSESYENSCSVQQI